MAATMDEAEAQNFWVSCLRSRLLETNDILSSDPYETVVAAHQKLLPELAAIQHVLAIAHARVHSLTITGRLPSEVLLHVFTCLSECDPASSRALEGSDDIYRKIEPPHLGWIVATHVCRRWRYLALSTPRLWSKVGAPFTVPWMDEMLIRSKQHPFALSARVEARDEKLCDVVLKALSPDHVWRMKGLHLAFEAHMNFGRLQNVEPRTSQVLAALTPPAPALESLAFSHLHLLAYDLRNIFGSNLPRLRRLGLHYCSGLSAVDLPGLRNVVDFKVTTTARSSMYLEELPLLLKRMPQLENLVVKDTTWWGRVPDELTFDPVFLPCLKSLFLKKGNMLHSNEIIAFLDRLRIPPTARREFELYEMQARDFRIVSMSATLRQVVPPATVFGDAGDPAARLSPSAIDFDCNVSGHAYDNPLFSFKAWVDDDPPWSGPRFGVRWTSRVLDASSVELMFGSFELHAVTRLAFSLADFDESACGALGDAFRRMPAVREIALRGASSSIRPLHRLLQAGVTTLGSGKLEGESGSNMQQVLFPHLMTLRISQDNLTRVVADDEGTDVALGDLLLGVIRTQAARRAPLHVLTITDCECIEPLLAELRAHVKDVRYTEHDSVGSLISDTAPSTLG